MQSLTIQIVLFYFICCLYGCDTSNKQNNSKHILKTKYFPNGNTQEIISYNYNNLKDSISTYYNQSGHIDSTVSYLDGKLEGVETIYYQNIIIRDIFENDSIISHNEYDSLDNLRLSTPININSVSRLGFKFNSGRNYFDKNKKDTIQFYIAGLPPYNRWYACTGAMLEHLTDTTFFINPIIKIKGLDEIKIAVSVRQNPRDEDEIPLKFDSIFIPIR